MDQDKKTMEKTMSEIKQLGSRFRRWFEGPLVKITLLIILSLACLIPVMLISGLTSERQSLRDRGWHKITAGWGGRQSVPGPYIRIPYIEYFTHEEEVLSREKHLVFFPQSLILEADVQAEKKELGIFRYPLYVLDGTFTGEFLLNRDKEYGVDSIQWDRALLVWELEGASSLAGWPGLIWQNQEAVWDKGYGSLGISQKALYLPWEIKATVLLRSASASKGLSA
jgi:hypothetical protein